MFAELPKKVLATGMLCQVFSTYSLPLRLAVEVGTHGESMGNLWGIHGESMEWGVPPARSMVSLFHGKSQSKTDDNRGPPFMETPVSTFLGSLDGLRPLVNTSQVPTLCWFRWTASGEGLTRQLEVTACIDSFLDHRLTPLKKRHMLE